MSDLVNTVVKGAADELEGYDLSVIEFTLLRSCLESREVTATALAEVLPVDASRISRIVTTLVEKGLLIRRRLRSDRRVVMLRLSEEGVALTTEIRQRMKAYEAKLMEHISVDDMQVFADVASKLVANHDAMKA